MRADLSSLVRLDPTRLAVALPLPRGWYAVCCAYLATPVSVRFRVSRQTLATYWRIKRLPRDWGEALDRREAPLAVMRWIGWAADRGERERRYREAIASFDGNVGWPRPGQKAPRGEAAGEQG